MFFRNLIVISIVSIFSGISLAYIFSLDYLKSNFYSLFVFYIPFIVTTIYAEKIYIKFVLEVYILGLIISVFLIIIFKIPLFPLLNISGIFYNQNARKIFEKKISSSEIGKISLVFLSTLLLLSCLGIIIKDFVLTFLSSILILSLLLPYSNSFGSSLFFYKPLLLVFFVIVSLLFLILSFLI